MLSRAKGTLVVTKENTIAYILPEKGGGTPMTIEIEDGTPGTITGAAWEQRVGIELIAGKHYNRTVFIAPEAIAF